MTFSLTALIALLMGLFFLALSGPGWGMCVSSRESSNRARLAALRPAKLPMTPLHTSTMQLTDRVWVLEPIRQWHRA